MSERAMLLMENFEEPEIADLSLTDVTHNSRVINWSHHTKEIGNPCLAERTVTVTRGIGELCEFGDWWDRTSNPAIAPTSKRNAFGEQTTTVIWRQLL